MFKGKLLNKRSVKLFLILILCMIVVIICGFAIILILVGFRATSVFVRIVVGTMSLTMGILTIRTILVKTHFKDCWRDWNDDLFSLKYSYEDDLYRQYSNLTTKYPMALAQYESDQKNRNSNLPNYKIMEKALEIDDYNWQKLEEAARSKYRNVST